MMTFTAHRTEPRWNPGVYEGEDPHWEDVSIESCGHRHKTLQEAKACAKALGPDWKTFCIFEGTVVLKSENIKCHGYLTGISG